MFNFRRVMPDYLGNLADLDTYGCDPMTIEGLRDEFEFLTVYQDELDGLVKI